MEQADRAGERRDHTSRRHWRARYIGQNGLDRAIGVGLGIGEAIEALDGLPEQRPHQGRCLRRIVGNVKSPARLQRHTHRCNPASLSSHGNLMKDEARDGLVEAHAQGRRIACETLPPLDIHARFSRLGFGAMKNVRIGVEPYDPRIWRPTFYKERKAARSATDVEDRFAVARRQLLKERGSPQPLARQQPDREIICAGQSGSPERGREALIGRYRSLGSRHEHAIQSPVTGESRGMIKRLAIGDLARQTGTKVNTVRFYEDIGLLPRAMRTASGRRTYGAADVRRLAFIRHGRGLGFSVEGIRSLLALADEPERDCAEAAAIARRHLQDIERRIARLETLRDALAEVAVSCEGGRAGDCRVIEAIADAELPA